MIAEETLFRSVHGFSVVFLTEAPAKDGFDAIAGWMNSGTLKKSPVTVYPVERVADAHRAGETVGELILVFEG